LSTLFRLGLVVIRGRFKFAARLVAVARVFLFFGRHFLHVPPHEVTKADIAHKPIHNVSCGLIISILVCTATSSPKPATQLALVGNLQLVVVECHFVNFCHDLSAFIAVVWENEFEADGFAEALADNIEKKLGPTHKPRKKTFAFGMDLVYEIIERLLVSFNEIDEYLDSLLRIFLADCNENLSTRGSTLQPQRDIRSSFASTVLMRSFIKLWRSPMESAMLAALYTCAKGE
jgi:hypothetical protein